MYLPAKKLTMTDSLPSTARSLPIALIRARESIMAPIREMLADTGLTEQQWRVLRVLSECGPQDATELADRACLMLPSLSRIARSMSEKGLITRSPDPNDGRRQTLEITANGAGIISSNRLEGIRIIEGFKARVGEGSYELLLDLLDALSGDPDD